MPRDVVNGPVFAGHGVKSQISYNWNGCAGGEFAPMQSPSDIPYWMRSIGHDLRTHCVPEPTLPFPVKLNLLHLLRLEGAMDLLHTHRGLF